MKSLKHINGLDASFDFQPLWSIHTCESYPHRLEGFPKIACWCSSMNKVSFMCHTCVYKDYTFQASKYVSKEHFANDFSH
jgi:hypothetical protein